MIACILQAVIINAATLPVFCNKFNIKGVISLKPETKDKRFNPPVPAYTNV